MIQDVVDLDDGAVLHANVGIVGAGFAGIDLARYLRRHGVQVMLLESGRLNFESETQALTRIESVGKPVRVPETQRVTLLHTLRPSTEERHDCASSAAPPISGRAMANLRPDRLRRTALDSLQRVAD